MTTPVKPSYNTPGWSGASERSEPPSGVKSAGLLSGSPLPAEYLNWIWYSMSGWVDYFRDSLPGRWLELNASADMYRTCSAGSMPWKLIGSALSDGDKLNDSGVGSAAATADLGYLLSALDGSTTTYRQIRTVRFYYQMSSGTVTVALESRTIGDNSGWAVESSTVISSTGTDLVNSSLAPNIDLEFAPASGPSGKSSKVYRLSMAWNAGGSFELYGLLLGYRANQVLVS